MKGLYVSDIARMADVITANSVKLFSVGAEEKIRPATDYEKQLHNEDRASATARLAIHNAMTKSE